LNDYLRYFTKWHSVTSHSTYCRSFQTRSCNQSRGWC